jgi:hypothetical protein
VAKADKPAPTTFDFSALDKKITEKNLKLTQEFRPIPSTQAQLAMAKLTQLRKDLGDASHLSSITEAALERSSTLCNILLHDDFYLFTQQGQPKGSFEKSLTETDMVQSAN